MPSARAACYATTMGTTGGAGSTADAGRAPARALLLALTLLHALGGVAGAQASVEPPSQERAATAPQTDEATLRALRLTHHAEKRREGLWLLAEGLLSTGAGLVAAGVLHGEAGALSASLTTASFGAVNALLALGLVDPLDRRRSAILAEAAPADRVRAREAGNQLRSGQAFALNAGLDLAYATAGAFLVAFAMREGDHAAWQRGAGLALIGQSGFLLGFDVACWMRSNRRAGQLSAR
jgi:hypothetical protein